MGEQTKGEADLVSDLNEFVRQSANIQSEIPETSGIRPHPLVESTEQTLDTTRFGFGFGAQPEAAVEPGGGPSRLTGACCFGDGSCLIETAVQCYLNGGTYQGDSSDCSPNPCGSITGACCVGNVCSILTSAECSSMHGSYLGNGTTCSGVDCTTVPQTGCCHCPDTVHSCDGTFCCDTLPVDCTDPCTFVAGFGGYGPAFCCNPSGSEEPCATCSYWPEELATHCCPSYPPAGLDYCCLNGYTCCGQGDSQCCNNLTEQCCFNVDPDSGIPFNYCCPIDGFECCGFDGCCPTGFCIGGFCTG